MQRLRPWCALVFVYAIACNFAGTPPIGGGGDDDDNVDHDCGDPPELPYVCADGDLPCVCNHDGEVPRWECSECPPIDCAADPNATVCKSDAACIQCHGLANAEGATGIENSHPWSYVGCTGCHGGVGVDPANPTRALTQEESHVAIPREMAAGNSISVPDETAYANHYLGRAGVEQYAGGEEWIRFMNPGDLRVVEQTCARSECHPGSGDKLRRSTMSTLVGKYDAMLYLAGMGRHPDLRSSLGTDSYDKRLATYGALDVVDPDWDPATSPPGSVGELRALVSVDREVDKPLGVFTEDDMLTETMNKLCGDCHLNNNGSNAKYGTFRSAGCTACHMPYDYSGRSRSGDPMIPKEEPSYPEAYSQIDYPERPHPRTHQLRRIMSVEDCLPCHTGSNRTVFQYMGIRTDDNYDLTRAKEAGSDITFTYAKLIDNSLIPEARLHGFDQKKLIEYEDLDRDGRDDTPPDVHYEAGLECVDCHTATEMHGDGRIYSRQNQATQIRCVHCHGNLEYPAEPDLDSNPINQLYFSTGKTTRKYLWKFDTVPQPGAEGYPYVTTPGIWMRLKSTGQWKYVAQIAWGVQWNPNNGQCFDDGENIDPRTNTFVCSARSSIAHGRWQGLNASAGDFDDGVGPRPGVEVVTGGDGATPGVRFGFSHLGEPAGGPNDNHAAGLECASCHASWHNMRYGNHLGLVDTDGTSRFYEWDRVTGESTIGKQGWFNFTFIDNLSLQLGVNSKGKIAYFIPTRLKMFFRALVLDPSTNQPMDFMTRVGDSGHAWKTYRDRVGQGNLLHNAADGVTGAPGYAQPCVETVGYCDNDPNKNVNGALGVDQMEPHTIRREARNCTSCHLDSGGANIDTVSAVYGWNPAGYTRATSHYLREIAQVVALQGTYTTANGFVIADDGIEHRLDWMVDEDTGYPLAGTGHVRIDDGRDGRVPRGLATYDANAGGPITKSVIELLKRVRVNDVPQN